MGRVALLFLALACMAFAALGAHDSPTLVNVFGFDPVEVEGGFVNGPFTIDNLTAFLAAGANISFVVTNNRNSTVQLCLTPAPLNPPADPSLWTSAGQCAAALVTLDFPGDADHTAGVYLNLASGIYLLSYVVTDSGEGYEAQNNTVSLNVTAFQCSSEASYSPVVGNQCGQTATELTNGTTSLSTKLELDEWDYYAFVIDSPAEGYVESFTVNATLQYDQKFPVNSSNPLSIFVRYGNIPVNIPGGFVASVNGQGNDSFVTLTVEYPVVGVTGNPNTDMWFIGVANNGADGADSSVNYEIYLVFTVSDKPLVVNTPSSTPGKFSKGSVAPGTFQYYLWNVTDSAGSISASTEDARGESEIALYLRKGAPPTLSQYDLTGCSRASCQYASYLEIYGEGSDGEWYVGVYGVVNPGGRTAGRFFTEQLAPATTNYYLWSGTECASNCSGHGTCNQGLCTCEKKYKEEFDCSVKSSTKSSSSSSGKLKTEYIVLIAVGGGILLGIVIGVIVYVVLKNRRRHKYQRV